MKSESVEKKGEFEKGDYVFVSKFSDEDPNDPWYVGFFSHKDKDRFYIQESNRAWRNCRKITEQEGKEILATKPYQEILSPLFRPNPPQLPLERKCSSHCDWPNCSYEDCVCDGANRLVGDEQVKSILKEPLEIQEPKYSEEQLVLAVHEAFKRGIDKCIEFMKSPECLEAISKYREGLTRRTEGGLEK